MREHYTINLTYHKVGDEGIVEDGKKFTLFIDHMTSMWPQKDGTCVIELTGERTVHVKESQETISRRGSGHNVIVPLEQS